IYGQGRQPINFCHLFPSKRTASIGVVLFCAFADMCLSANWSNGVPSHYRKVWKGPKNSTLHELQKNEKSAFLIDTYRTTTCANRSNFVVLEIIKKYCYEHRQNGIYRMD